jgi:3-methyladenine DNA glycosylase AlkC
MAGLLREVFNHSAVAGLADRLSIAHSGFDGVSFINAATNALENLNYAERLEQITDCLQTHLTNDYRQNVEIITASATEPVNLSDSFVFSSRHFINLPLCRYISKFGLHEFAVSMQALKTLTKSFTSEYDIRYFIEKYPSDSIAMIKGWTSDPDLHVRRLASEGTRPRLPMGKRLHIFVKDPAPILPILEDLKNDPELYVRRSAANSLNDISKDHPDLAANTAEKWLAENSEHSEWMYRHAMRTLFRSGHAKALENAGYPRPEGITADSLKISRTAISVGDDLEFSFVLKNASEKDMDIMADYEISFVKANGRLSPKVFKLKKIRLAKNSTQTLSGTYKIRQRTTRKFYTGTHTLAIMVNGKKLAQTDFHLSA